MKKITLLFFGLFALTLTSELFAQNVTIDGVFRPRFENRHGYTALFPEDAQAANFISQRSRLNMKFANDNFKVGFSLQNIGIWGETEQLNDSDKNHTMIYEAWGEFLFCEKISVKAGRQAIVYDDQRIFGSVDWAQQGRSHDALIFKIKPNEECNVDIGVAYNSEYTIKGKEPLVKDHYSVNNYKTFQYIHWHRSFGDFKASLLFLNNGMPWIDQNDTTSAGVAKEKIAYSQTIGPRVSYQKDGFTANAAFYYQMGKAGNDSTDLAAMYFGADVAFQAGENLSIGLGFEYLSGNDIVDGNDKQNAFTPFYGTNHKFNGWMDHFYVGNWVGSVGLVDVYLPIKYAKGKFSAMLIPHFFMAAGDVPDIDNPTKAGSKELGTEIDLGLGYNVAKGAAIKAGFSIFNPSDVYAGKDYNESNTWGWVMFVFKPTFYKSDKSN